MVRACPFIFSTLAVLALAACPSHASTPAVAGTGAVGVNASWEAGASSSWYIELQRLGGADIAQGIQREDDALIRTGIHILDWGFAHEATDGSFPGTGDPFHSAAIFAESAANASILLRSYHPKTYSADLTYYSSVVQSYKTKLHSVGLWLIAPANATPGQQFDQPYTHRRYLLAAALGQIGNLYADSAISSAAAQYARNGLLLQMTAGTQQVVYPDHTTHTVSMVGVNPELGGYDVSYQCAGILYSQHFYNICSDAALRSSLRSMMSNGLLWESKRITSSGVLDAVGSTRIGIEVNRDGTLKTPNDQEIISAFSNGYTYTNSLRFLVTAYRYLGSGRAVTSDTVASDGAVNANYDWERGTASTWSISQQRIGADYVETGIQTENDAVIRKGILILNWGWAHQLSDGSFGTTTTPYYASAQFIEAAARASLLLKSYAPGTYGADLTYFKSIAATFASNCNKTGNWLTTATNWPIVQHNCLGSTCRNYALAAGLATTAVAAGNPALNIDANLSAATAAAMQVTGGMNPEGGTSDINTQALGLTYAARYIVNIPASITSTTVKTALSSGINWELQFILIDGSITGTSSPATKTIDTALELGYAIIADPRYVVYRERMNLPEMQLY